MNKRYTSIYSLLVFTICLLSFTSCENEEENILYTPPVVEDVTHPNDIYNQGLLENYGTAVRWRWDDRFVKPDQRATPIADSLVIPVTRLLEHFWIGAYESQGEDGKRFMAELFPPELQYIGSYIYKSNGNILLGYAENGARITLLNLNNYDATNRAWLGFPAYNPKYDVSVDGGLLATIHHEFGHIIHMNYGFPTGFNAVSDSYTGAGWSNGLTPLEARKMGMVSPYGTCDEREDFCELLSHYLIMPKADFEQKYLVQKELDLEKLIEDGEQDINIKIKDAQEENEGKAKIALKLDMLKKYFIKSFNINLEKLQAKIEADLNYLIENNKIPTE